MRLIDAEFLTEVIAVRIKPDGHEMTNRLMQKVIDVVKAMPTIDAEPVVRCEDCIWHRERNEKEQEYLIEGVLICTSSEANDDGWLPVFPTHFCSYGERKDGE